MGAIHSPGFFASAHPDMLHGSPGAYRPNVVAGHSQNAGTRMLQILLSTRERDVLCWLTHGKTGDEIGIILSISECTVRTHIRNIMRKLDASNITHAVARAFRSGILD
jgi:DNA-binding CsgD family transcriptional regulator